MKIRKEDVESLLKAIDNLIELKLIIRKTTPNYQLNESDKGKFISILKILSDKLKPIFSDYLKEKVLLEEKESIQNKRERIIKALSQANFFLISSNSAKKKLKDLGADPRNLLVSGGPFFSEDYQKVNPNIPDQALIAIKKKSERLKAELQNENWNEKNLYFIYEKDDIADKLTLEKIDRISDLIGKEVITIGIESWDELTNRD